jgi:glycine cleavage system H protein
VYAPIAGQVVAMNEALPGAPEALNADAYAAWLFRIKPADASALAAMLDAAAYEKLIGEA